MDNEHQYECICCHCQKYFIGDKREVSCPKCKVPLPAVGVKFVKLHDDDFFETLKSYSNGAINDSNGTAIANAIAERANLIIESRVIPSVMSKLPRLKEIEEKAVLEFHREWVNNGGGYQEDLIKAICSHFGTSVKSCGHDLDFATLSGMAVHVQCNECRSSELSGMVEFITAIATLSVKSSVSEKEVEDVSVKAFERWHNDLCATPMRVTMGLPQFIAKAILAKIEGKE